MRSEAIRRALRSHDILGQLALRSLDAGEVELVAAEGGRLQDRGCQRPRELPISFMSDARAVDDLADIVLEQWELRGCVRRRPLPFLGEG